MAAPTAPPTGPAIGVPTIPSVGTTSNRLTLVTAGAVLLIGAAAGGYVSFVRADRAAALATRTREVSQLKQQLGTPERVKTAATADQLKLGIGAVQAALATPSPWTALLVALSDRTPAGVTLTSVAIDPKLTLRINGTAGAYTDVAKFLAALQGSPSFADVGLDTSAKSDTTAGSVVAFAVTATFVPAQSANAQSATPSVGAVQ